MSNTAHVSAADIEVGDVISWSTWTGERTSATVTFVDRLPSGRVNRISTNKPGVWWEATCFATIDESLNRTRNLEVAKS